MLEIDLNKLKAELERDEKRMTEMYLDSEGVPTIGIGHNLNVPICDESIDIIFACDINEVLKYCRKLPYWRNLSPTRRRVVANMVFNLGYEKFLGFKKLNKALAASDWDTAADEMVDSKWYRQVKTRSPRLVKAMRTDDERHILV